MANEEPSIVFDKNHELRIFDPEKFNTSVQLAEKSEEFGESKYFKHKKF